MENIKNSTSIGSHNLVIKAKIQKNSIKLYQLIEQCLDLTQWKCIHPVSLDSCPCPCSVTQRKENQKIMGLIKNQMSKLALSTSQYDECLLKISKKLLEDQLVEQQSNQMQIILRKYHQNLISLRSHKIEKQNQFYMFFRNTYECYQDEYENCTPTPDRLKGMQLSHKAKRQILEQCKIFLNELKDIESILVKVGDKVGDEEFSQDKQVGQSNIARVENRLDQSFQNKQIQDSIAFEVQTKYRKIDQLNIIKQSYWQKEPFKSRQNQSKQNLPPLYSSMLNQYDQQTSQCLKTWTNSRQRDRNSSIPNFSHMSQRDYNVFKIYWSKICRQTQRHEKLMQEYDNYIQVYRFLMQQNKQLITNYRQQQKKPSYIGNILENDRKQEQKQQQDINLNIINESQLQSQLQSYEKSSDDDKQNQNNQIVDQFTIRKKNRNNNEKIDQFLQIITPNFIKNFNSKQNFNAPIHSSKKNKNILQMRGGELKDKIQELAKNQCKFAP